LPDNQNITFINNGDSKSLFIDEKHLLDNVSAVVIITNRFDEIVYVNKQFTDTFLYDFLHVINKPLTLFLENKDAGFLSVEPNSIQNLNFFSKEGKSFDLKMFSFPLKDNEGSYSGQFYISANLKLNRGLIAGETAISEFFRINKSVLYKIDKNFKVLECINGISDEIFPFDEDAAGKKLHDTIPLEFLRKVDKILRDTIKNNVNSTVQIKLPKKNGKVFQLGIRVNTDESILLLFQEGIGSILSRESLRKTERRIRLIWEKSVDGMRLLDSTGRMVALNPSFGRIVEINAEQLIGKKYYEVYDVNKEDIPNLEADYIKNFKARSFDEFFITKLKLKSGRYVYLEVSNNFIDSYHGDPDLFGGEILLFSILRDITDRKYAEDKVRDREELYRSLIETSPDGICLYTPEGEIITCNQQTAELFGFVNINEMLEYKSNLYEYFSESSKNSGLEDSKKIIEYGHLNNMEYEFIHFDGSSFYGEMSSSVLFNRANHPRALVSVLRNITERKIASEKIKRSELLFRSVWKNSKDGMRLTDSEGIIVEVNPAFCQMVELKAEDLIGTNLFSVYRLRSKDDYERKLARYKLDFVKRYYKPNYNIAHTLNSGKRLILDSSFSFVEYQDEEVLLLSVLRDVTEKRAIEEQLNLNAKLAAIGKMALYLTHEIKTPLSSIKLNVDILTQTLKVNEQQNRSFSILKKEIKRLEKLLKDVLHFSKATELNITELDFYIMIENIGEILSPILSEKNITFINSIEPFRIEGDYQKLLSAILQVIENSVDAITYGGTIELYSAAEQDGSIRIYVRDDGCGIEDSEKIFDPFYTTKNSGTGLGLAIAKNIIEHHYGTLKLVSSRPGETIFEIFFNIGN